MEAGPFDIHPFGIRQVKRDSLVTLEQMKEVDFYAVSQYDLPIELMMENAGLHLARLVTEAADPGATIVVGCGKGNNGGGGLVAARRLSAWGYPVYLDLPEENFRQLPAMQLQRALSFGVKMGRPKRPGIAVDAYFGFNFHFPMRETYAESVEWMNSLKCPVISLDLPSGLTEEPGDDQLCIQPDAVCVLGAPKKAAFSPKSKGVKFIADLGIPRKAFRELDIPVGFDFSRGTIFECQLI